MKKALTIALIVALAAIALSACSNNQAAITYEVITDPSELPQDVQDEIQTIKVAKGYYMFADNYLFISLGEQPTDGYALDVESVELENNTLNVVVQEQEPDGTAATVITYPYIVLELEANTEDAREEVQVVNSEQEEYPNIAELEVIAAPNTGNGETTEPALATGVEHQGVYVGMADPHTIAIKVDGEEHAFQLSEETRPYFEEGSEEYLGLEQYHNVVFEFDWQEPQMILTSISKLSSAQHGSEQITIDNAKANYVGQIDSNFVEVVLIEANELVPRNNETIALKIYEDITGYFDPQDENYQDFKEGESVTICFSLNQEGQFVLTDIQRVDK